MDELICILYHMPIKRFKQESCQLNFLTRLVYINVNLLCFLVSVYGFTAIPNMTKYYLRYGSMLNPTT